MNRKMTREEIAEYRRTHPGNAPQYSAGYLLWWTPVIREALIRKLCQGPEVSQNMTKAEG